MALSLGAEGVSYLEAGQWQASANHRFLAASQGYIGTERDPTYKDKIGARLRVNSLDTQLTYAFTSRYSATLTIPLVYGEASEKFSSFNHTRHKTSAAGLGDVRLVGNMWVFDPGGHPHGNISLGCGVKAPTGDYKATDTFYESTGKQNRPVDQALQPGDGGWGVQLELVAFQKIYHQVYGYMSGFYLINPQEQNGAYTVVPYPPGPNAAVRKNSVPDQYLGRLGLSWLFWPAYGLSVSLGGRIDGIPPRDAVGGSEGFRRPGYSLFVEPGVSWTFGKNTFNLFVPALVQANRQKNIYDDRYGFHGPGAFGDYVVITSFTRQF